MKDIKQALLNGERIEVQYSDDTMDRVHVQKVCGGLMLPTAQSRAYFCILGQLLDRNSKFKHPCILLSETEADLPEQFYKLLCNEARKLLCWSFFCDYTDSNYEFRVSLSKYLRKRDLSRVSIKFPYIGDWVNGVLTIRQYSKDGALEIPKDSIMGRQLGQMEPDDQQESQRSRFYAVDALRCVLGGFERPSRSWSAPPEPGFFYG
jgi:hypothetical protein